MNRLYNRCFYLGVAIAITGDVVVIVFDGVDVVVVVVAVDGSGAGQHVFVKIVLNVVLNAERCRTRDKGSRQSAIVDVGIAAPHE